MNRAEAEQEEELSEWVVIQTSPKSPPIDASTPPNSPILQPSHRRENPTDDDDDDDDEDSVVPVIGEEEGESSSTVNLSLPWRMIETTKKRLIQDSVFFFRSVEKLVRWWKRLHEEKLRFLLLLLREKDQKIKELMVEIGKLNELLSSRRRVRVVRIV